ncbi:radical SAM protein [Thermoanaerobacterium thermosaccharolyticum]|jgi:radical SAM peptide maturase (CXXX-repeat target family)/CXXX repeat peptide maturase|uniref:radical SAM peptide maturase, CXXX-repeat target family n=1 Tax=Thermoanaerobacterium thermosaccharolyticum TaxID=1517 RepID=UPI000C076D15|nr:radical SAM peptide maturase, CXXX-repeat target family [Thermoanaerobacterium thermosaccharolyticum]KAA5806826.1 radical SAM peptide maturase, CXXX-repeat target family [Thermoanaerobacterium thermosaccharolyticum]PHO06092.1 radical SAM protein [Thermoanaerobacterium thermosaccharolyticum]
MDTLKMGILPKTWKNGMAKTITFCVTEDCNLNCKYCYMNGKNSKNKMTFDIAKKAVDYILSNREMVNDEAVVWEFIGGEPLLEIELIDKISDYIKIQMYKNNHPWFNNYRFSLSTNGILYHKRNVQKYIKKNHKHLSIGISIDGNKIKHDLQRIKKDGSGSYDDVIKNIPLWLDQFPNASTKATFSHEDLPYLKDSIINLWNIGIKNVAANIVFENVWEEDDDIIFENQLKQLADYILENKLWNDYSVRFFDPHIGFPLTNEELNKNYCGAGKMLAIDTEGKFYPCIRFLDFCLNNRNGYCIGDIYNGLDLDRLRPFKALNLHNQIDLECLNCSVASGCAYCTGFNYDDNGTIFERTKYNCKMHMANVRSCDYFWNKFTEITGSISPREEYKRYRLNKKNKQYLLLLTSDDVVPHCIYYNKKSTNNMMDKNLIIKGLNFAQQNNMIPAFIGYNKFINNELKAGDYLIFIDWENYKNNFISKVCNKNSIIIYDGDIREVNNKIDNCILFISKQELDKLYTNIERASLITKRINIIIKDLMLWNENDIKIYNNQLDKVNILITNLYKSGFTFEINILTDLLYLKTMCDCGAGIDNFTLAPNGKIYYCPAFYFDNPDDYIGTIESGIDFDNIPIKSAKGSPGCKNCDAFHCRRCIYLNKKFTNEFNIPPKIQCIISHIERNKSKELQRKLMSEDLMKFSNVISDIDYLDPLEKYI